MTKATSTLTFTAMPANELIPTPEIFLGLFTKSTQVERLDTGDYARSLGMTLKEFIDGITEIGEKEVTIEDMAGAHSTNEMGFLGGYYKLEDNMAVNKKFEDLGIVGIYADSIKSTFSYGDDHWGEEAKAANKYWNDLRMAAYGRRDNAKAKNKLREKSWIFYY